MEPACGEGTRGVLRSFTADGGGVRPKVFSPPKPPVGCGSSEIPNGSLIETPTLCRTFCPSSGPQLLASWCGMYKAVVSLHCPEAAVVAKRRCICLPMSHAPSRPPPSHFVRPLGSFILCVANLQSAAAEGDPFGSGLLTGH